MLRNHLALLLCLPVLAGLCSCRKPTRQEAAAPGGKAGKPSTEPARDPYEWRDLFDGKTLTGWKVPVFGGDGKVYVKDGAVHMEAGAMCTGFTYAGDPNKLPREDYELELEAMRVEGVDFFCGLTFPVGGDYISLILDGWGGSVTGLSCINGYDASDNETTQDVDFKNNRWYFVRVRVTAAHITCWVDDEQIIQVAREGRAIGIRPEVELSRPLGIATWQTHGAVRGIQIRKLRPGTS